MKFSIFKRSYTAHFPPIASILTALLCLGLIQLGQWQQHRAQWKTHYLQRQQAQSNQHPLSLATLLSQPHEKSDFLPLQLRGHFDNKQTILLDNRYRQHRPGFEVLTPFFDEGSHQWILVNRGWLPSTATHHLEKPILPITGIRTILGHTHIPSKKGLIIGNNLTAAHPPVIQQIRLAELSQTLNRTFLPFTLRLAPDPHTDYDRKWTLTTLSPARHRAYAFQWYALAVTLIVCFLGVNIERCQ